MTAEMKNDESLFTFPIQSGVESNLRSFELATYGPSLVGDDLTSPHYPATTAARAFSSAPVFSR
jgi:hypothetical protein